MTNATNLYLFSTLSLNLMCLVFGFDTSPLQDFCVADPTTNGCKHPAKVGADDFFFSGLHKAGNTTNPYGVSATKVSAATVAGLNNLGMTFMRVDLAPDGFFPPHIHPRATELVTVLEGSLEIGFITSYPEYKYFSKAVKQGDVFVVPVGLLHNVRNLGKGNSVALVAFNSQNPGITNFPNALFQAKPAVDTNYLAKAFKLDKITVEDLKKRF